MFSFNSLVQLELLFEILEINKQRHAELKVYKASSAQSLNTKIK